MHERYAYPAFVFLLLALPSRALLPSIACYGLIPTLGARNFLMRGVAGSGTGPTVA